MIWSQVIRLGFRERPKIQVQTPLLLFFSFHSLHLNNGELKQPLALFQQTTKRLHYTLSKAQLLSSLKQHMGPFSVHDSLASLAISTHVYPATRQLFLTMVINMRVYSSSKVDLTLIISIRYCLYYLEDSVSISKQQSVALNLANTRSYGSSGFGWK